MAVSLAPVGSLTLPTEVNWTSGRRRPLTRAMAMAQISSIFPPAPFLSSSFSGFKLRRRNLALHSCVGIASSYGVLRRTLVSASASLGTNGNDSRGSELPPFTESDKPVSMESLPLESKERMLLEQKLRMKLAKKVRLRRNRLVRKRRMRKKGRWPPSKMKKNKNV